MSETKKNKSYRFGPFRLDIDDRLLFRGQSLVSLSGKPFDVLRFLVENSNRPFSAEEILNKVWPDKDVEQNNVTQAISAMRKALGDTHQPYEYIETIKAAKESKYRFIAKVSEDVEPSKPEPPPQLSKNEMIPFQEWLHGPGRRIKWFLGSFVILMVVFSVALLVWELNTKASEQRAKSSISMSFVSMAELIVICLILFKYPPRPKKVRPIKTEEDKVINKEVGKALGYDDPDEWANAQKIAEELQERYKLSWWGVLATWILLYGLLGILYLIFPNSNDNESNGWLLRIFINLVNNFNTMLVYLCYIILNKPVASENEDRNTTDTSWIFSKAINGVAVIVTIFFVELVAVWIPHSYEKFTLQKILLGIFTLGSALIGCIVMALYVGRLQSKFLNPPPWLIFALYSYTATQSFYWYLADYSNLAGPKIDEMIRLIGQVLLIDTYLGLKCLLYLYMTWLFQSGPLLYYLARVGHTYHKVEEEWRLFRNILKVES
jgi:DNA-binding winged helix-turn-helix (wHTH) protein